MKKIFYSSTFILLFLGMYLASCKKETAITATQSTTTQLINLQEIYKEADAAGIMLYNHLRYNFLTVKPIEYFVIPYREKFNSDLKTFNDQTAGMRYEDKLNKLKELRYVSENENIYLTKFINNLGEKENDMNAAMELIEKQRVDIANSPDLSTDEKIRLTIYTALLKYPARYLIENNLSNQKNTNDASKNASFRCLFGSQFFCTITSIAVGVVIGTVSGFYSATKDIDQAIAAFIGGLAGGASTAASFLINCGDCNPPTCAAPDVASLAIAGGCNTSGTIYITGGLDSGQGFGAINTNASPNTVLIPSGTNSFNISQNSSNIAYSDIFPICTPSSGASSDYKLPFNIYSLIHTPGSPSAIQGNSSPSSGSVQTYYVLGDVNKPGSNIVASVQGSLGTVIGSVAGQQGYTVQVNWFRSGSGSLTVQTQSACGEISSSITLPVTVH